MVGPPVAVYMKKPYFKGFVGPQGNGNFKILPLQPNYINCTVFFRKSSIFARDEY